MKILIICPSDPFNPSTGGQNRTYNLFNRISEDHEIATLEPHTNKNTSPSYTISNRYFYRDYKICSKRVGYFLSSLNPKYYSSLYKSITDFSPDIIHKVGPNGAVPLSIFGRNYDVIYSAHNFEYQHAEEIDANPIERKVTEYVTKFEELVACRSFDLVIAVSDKDKQRFVNHYDIDNVVVIPSGVDISTYNSKRQSSVAKKELNIDPTVTTVGFHGTYWYPPNKEAVELIRDKIAPRHSSEDIVFLLAGSNMPEFEEENIQSVGFIDDLSVFLDALDIAIVPIITGGGTNIKIFDYMGSGTPMIITNIAAKGIDIESGTDTIIIDDLDKFSSEIRRLENDVKLRDQLSQNSREKAESTYNWENISDKLESVYAKIKYS